MKGKYTGSVPLNARVTVDYGNGSVKFSYPNRVNRDAAMKEAILMLYMIFLLGYMFLVGGSILMLAVISMILTPPALPSMTMPAITEGMIRTAAYAALLFLPPLALTMYVVGDEDRFKVWFPKINARWAKIMGQRSYCTVFRKTNDRKVEIPMFRNMVMDYKAVGEFGKSLQKVEIKEHDFSVRLRKGKIRNAYLWKAIFTFKEDCNKGYLKVDFI